MSNIYLVGQVVRITAEVRGETGMLEDPGALMLMTRMNAGPVSSQAFGADVAVVRDEVGRYHIDLQLTAAGVLYYRWESNAPNAGAIEGELVIRAGRFAT